MLFGVLVVGSGLIGLAAQSTNPNATPSVTSADPNAAPSITSTDPNAIPGATSEATGSFLNDPNLSQQPGLGIDSGKLFVKMLGSVVLVIALAGAVLYLSKKVLPKVTNTAGKEIRVVETTYLGPRKALHLVEVGHQKLLIGSTNESIATLAHVGDAWLDLSKQETDPAVST
jgi:flagellar biosynthetic protein FliO